MTETRSIAYRSDEGPVRVLSLTPEGTWRDQLMGARQVRPRYVTALVQPSLQRARRRLLQSLTEANTR